MNRRSDPPLPESAWQDQEQRWRARDQQPEAEIAEALRAADCPAPRTLFAGILRRIDAERLAIHHRAQRALATLLVIAALFLLALLVITSSQVDLPWQTTLCGIVFVVLAWVSPWWSAIRRRRHR